jgi:hypothetical protein
MAERERLLPVFGSDLLEEEARGVQGMRRMLGYITQIKDSSTEEAGEENVPYSISLEANLDGVRDVMLPPYVCKELCAIRDASPKNPQEYELAMSKFVTLVPHLPTRKRFVRIFKRAVAFAPWRFGYFQEAAEEGEKEDRYPQATTVVVTIDQYGRKKHSSQQGGKEAGASANLQFFASRNAPGFTFASPVKHISRVEVPRDKKSLDAKKASIPYAARRAKSDVVRLEGLRRGQAYNRGLVAETADEKLSTIISRNEEFYQKNRLKERRWAR